MMTARRFLRASNLALVTTLTLGLTLAGSPPSLATPNHVPIGLEAPQDDAPLESWPQEISDERGSLVLYQPQPEKLTGNVVSGRAAFQLELTGQEPVFGAFWFDARLGRGDTDGVYSVESATITRVSWPESEDDLEARFRETVGRWMSNAGFSISRERLSASLADAQQELASLDMIKNDPPVIVFREELAVLLMYDGEPRFAEIENSDYERALNTPFAVARRKGSDTVYLSSGKFWYQAPGPMGPFAPTSSPPSDLVQMMPEPEEDEGGPDSPPSIVTASEPTELIATDGPPEWQSLSSGELLYVSNTETAWIRLLSTNEMFILLSGRWFKSTSNDGPWEFVRGDKLPTAFSDIPPDSDIGGVRTSVAGTDEADEALLDAQIPEVTAIKRSEASLTVEYDGDPKFEGIEGTSVAYAVNTAAQVLQIDGRYYAVDNAVWFTSVSATGPWAVADTIPEDQIKEIPPSSPVYNVTHVHVYESDPEVVYVGYTPGYMWSYPYYGVPIYGTGWYYPPYYGGVYYPRTPTWGFHVGYNPWTGWNFGLSWSNGFFSIGIGWSSGWGGGYRPCCGGWYGGGYRGPTFINTGDINIGNNVNIGNRNEIGNRIDNDRLRGGDTARNRGSLYDRPQNRARNADRSTLNRDVQRARPATGRANDVFADRNGNVARRSGDQWQTRSNGQWQNSGQNRATNNRATTSRSLDRGSLDRSYSSRQRGSMRERSTRSFNRGGARRGGGGIRRR